MMELTSPWIVQFSRTSFLNTLLSTHKNVREVKRTNDILFSFRRNDCDKEIKLLGIDQYACSLAIVLRALEDFGEIHYICVGGVWDGYSRQAKDYCLENKIGLYNTSELSGGLWTKEYWNYAKKDDDGNRIYNYKTST